MFPNQLQLHTELTALGYTNGSLDDRLYSFLLATVAIPGLALPDLLYVYLADRGYTGSLQDMIKQIGTDAYLSVPWTPADIPGILDYGDLSDTSLLKQTSVGTGDVGINDPVGYWRGKMGVITLIQPSTPAKPVYTSSGVYFQNTGVDRGLYCTISSRPYGNPVFLGVTTTYAVKFNLGVNFTGLLTGMSLTGNTAYLHVRGSSAAPFYVAATGSNNNLFFNWNGDLTTASGLVNNVQTATRAAAANTTNSTQINLGIGVSSTVAPVVSRWVVVNRLLTPAELVLLNTWMTT